MENIKELEKELVLAKLDVLITKAELLNKEYDFKKLNEIKEYILKN